MLWCKNRVSDQLGRTYVGNLILTPTEIQGDTLKPDATNNMQLFQDFDNEGFDVSKLLFDISQGKPKHW